MKKEAIGTGATIDEAREVAIKELGAPEDADVLVEVLEIPTKKTLGIFGGNPAKVKAYYQEDPSSSAEDFLKTILDGMGIEGYTMKGRTEGQDIFFDVDCGDYYTTVVGRRGETLDAIQYLVRLAINRDADDYYRVSINVGNYREKRENALKMLARKSAIKVVKYGRNVVLDPMNPYERRIIHTTVQDIEGATSHSVGEGDNRKVVITLKPGVKPTFQGNGGGYNKRYNNRNGQRGGYNKNYNNRGPRNYNNNSVYRAPEDRKPVSDLGGTSLYGKIEKKED